MENLYDQYLVRLKDTDSLKLDRHIVLWKRDDYLAVTLYATEVVKYHPDGSIVLQAGGYRTMTTRGVMNDYLPPGYTLSQKNNEWWLNGPDEQHVPYADGMRIAPDGSLPEGEASKWPALINKYLRALTTEAVDQAIEDREGDCWICLHELATSRGLSSPVPLVQGSVVNGAIVEQPFPAQSREHLEDHVRQGVVSWTMLVLALMHARYTNPEFVLLAQKGNPNPTLIKRAVKKFLLARLVESAGN